MKKVRNIIALLLCAILLVGASVAGTVAYLTSNDKVVNTFTVGKVIITLDETDTDHDNKLDDNVTVVVDGDEIVRDKANEYKLIPGQRYKKDPVIHVDSTSESCWVFVKVINGIDAFEARTTTGDNAYTDIAGQIAANKWTPLEGVDNVYYKEYEEGQDDKDLEVFQEFKLADNAESVDGWDSINGNTTITVTGYAVQKAGLNTVLEAWNAVSAGYT